MLDIRIKPGKHWGCHDRQLLQMWYLTGNRVAAFDKLAQTTIQVAVKLMAQGVKLYVNRWQDYTPGTLPLTQPA